MSQRYINNEKNNLIPAPRRNDGERILVMRFFGGESKKTNGEIHKKNSTKS